MNAALIRLLVRLFLGAFTAVLAASWALQRPAHPPLDAVGPACLAPSAGQPEMGLR